MNIITSKFLSTNEISVDFLRLDTIHPIISGNKWFKLSQFPHQENFPNIETIITYGGNWSNHLLATAYFAKLHQKKSIGYVFTHQPNVLTQTLIDAQHYGMKIEFVNRKDFYFKMNNPILSESVLEIPMGGFCKLGIHGAKQILNIKNVSKYNYIITAVGTGATLAGLYLSLLNTQKIIGVCVVKTKQLIEEDIKKILQIELDNNKIKIFYNFHLGGIGKYNSQVLNMKENLQKIDEIPTDIIYLAKTSIAVQTLIKQGYFLKNDKILIIHNGGLQGNRSLDNC